MYRSHDHSGMRRRDVLDTVHALQSGAIVEMDEKRQQARLVTRFIYTLVLLRLLESVALEVYLIVTWVRMGANDKAWTGRNE